MESIISFIFIVQCTSAGFWSTKRATRLYVFIFLPLTGLAGAGSQPGKHFLREEFALNHFFGKNLPPQPRSTMLKARASVNRAPMDTHKPRFRQPRQPE